MPKKYFLENRDEVYKLKTDMLNVYGKPEDKELVKFGTGGYGRLYKLGNKKFHKFIDDKKLMYDRERGEYEKRFKSKFDKDLEIYNNGLENLKTYVSRRLDKIGAEPEIDDVFLKFSDKGVKIKAHYFNHRTGNPESKTFYVSKSVISKIFNLPAENVKFLDTYWTYNDDVYNRFINNVESKGLVYLSHPEVKDAKTKDLDYLFKKFTKDFKDGKISKQTYEKLVTDLTNIYPEIKDLEKYPKYRKYIKKN